MKLRKKMKSILKNLSIQLLVQPKFEIKLCKSCLNIIEPIKKKSWGIKLKIKIKKRKKGGGGEDGGLKKK